MKGMQSVCNIMKQAIEIVLNGLISLLGTI